MLAKLTSSMHKPAQQTVVPSSYVPALLASLPIKKIGQLGGKLGKSLKEDLGVTTAADLLPFPEIKLQDLYGVNTGTWLWNVARGRSGDKVQGRVLPKSHSCSKTFAGPKSLKDMASVSIFFWPFHLLETMCSCHPPGVQTCLGFRVNSRP
jgi:DNA polymerase eta